MSFFYSNTCACRAIAYCSMVAYFIAAILATDISILTHTNDYTYTCSLTINIKTFVAA
jgi:hypothetical protein